MLCLYIQCRREGKAVPQAQGLHRTELHILLGARDGGKGW